MDLNRVLMDTENIEDIPKDENLKERMRYSAINVEPRLLAMILHNSAPLKNTFGQASYPLAGIKEINKGYQAD